MEASPARLEVHRNLSAASNVTFSASVPFVEMSQKPSPLSQMHRTSSRIPRGATCSGGVFLHQSRSGGEVKSCKNLFDLVQRPANHVFRHEDSGIGGGLPREGFKLGHQVYLTKLQAEIQHLDTGSLKVWSY